MAHYELQIQTRQHFDIATDVVSPATTPLDCFYFRF